MSSDPSDIQAARRLLDRLGIQPEQLVAVALHDRRMPTFGEYIPQVANATTAGAAKAYGPYWQRIIQQWRDRPIIDPSASELASLIERARTTAVKRRNSRGGASAAEHMHAAIRCLYRQAVADALLAAVDDPSRLVPKPRRPPTSRRAIPPEQLHQILEVARTTGNDRQLDSLLLRLHLETACRRGGALNLQASDIDDEQCLLQLHEKNNSARWQPASPTLVRALLHHQAERAPGNAGPVLRYRDGTPLSHRRYDHLWKRIATAIPWAATHGISTHWLRHTTLTWVERNFGYATARAYAGHAPEQASGATATYVRADITEIATALAALTNEPHPLAHGSDPTEKCPPRNRLML